MNIIIDMKLDTKLDPEKYDKLLPMEAQIAANMLSLVYQAISWTIEMQLSERDWCRELGFTEDQLAHYETWHWDNEAYKDCLDLTYQSLPYSHLRTVRRS